MRKKDKVCVSLTPAERRLLIRGLLFLRSKVLDEEIDTVDIDRLLKKVLQ